MKAMQQLEKTKAPVLHKVDESWFIVDVNKREIREQFNPENVISINSMAYRGTHYEFEFDRKRKNLENFDSKSSDVMLATMPLLKDLDPVSMSEKYGRSLQAVQNLSDYEIIVKRGLLEARVANELPTMDIMNTMFFVHLKEGAVRPLHKLHAKGLRFDELLASPDDKTYSAIYNPKTHSNEFLPISEIRSIPTNLVLIEFPTEPFLDPLQYYRSLTGMERFDEFLKRPDENRRLQEFLMEYPPVKLPPARVVPWVEIHINDVITRNLQKDLQREDKEQKMGISKSMGYKRKSPSR